MKILGIETSCDETAAAVVEDGKQILANVVSSQIPVHSPYGGVVPELASRQHIKNIIPVIRACLDQAELPLSGLDAIAVCRGPGLIGSLLIGVSAAKAMAYAAGLPLVPVNHLEAHLAAILVEHQDVAFPAVSLVVSGGHTALLLQEDLSTFRRIGATRDDAAGEAYDKVAKLLGLGYPGGPVIDRLAQEGNDRAVAFARAKISDGRPDFSFSGLKSAVVRHVKEHGIRPLSGSFETPGEDILDLLASFQRAVVDGLVYNTRRAMEILKPKSLLVAGGVASNSRLRAVMCRLAASRGARAFFPSGAMSTDNGAMIAGMGYYKFLSGETAGLDLDADPRLSIPVVGEAWEAEDGGSWRDWKPTG